MPSEMQIAANRQNARKSTGPRTKGGRSRARLNSLAHGLTARQVVILDESEKAFTDFFGQMVASLNPENAIERHLAEEAAIAAWKLRRSHRIESRQFETERLRLERAVQESRDPYDDERVKHLDPNYFGRFPRTPEEETNEPDKQFISNPARLFNRLTREIETLSRYRTGLERSLYRALNQLERLQAKRNGAVVPLPHVLDVHIDRGERGSAGGGQM